MSIGEVLAPIIRDRGVLAAVTEYDAVKRARPSEYDFGERELNSLGYQLLRGARVDDAIEIFKLNVRAYPDQANTYDSLGEAYAGKGLTDLAIQNYERSLQLNPANTNAVERLRKLRPSR